MKKGVYLPMMSPLPSFTLPQVLCTVSFDLFALQLAGALDLTGLAVGVWTLWSSISLPLGGKLQRAFQLIGIGTAAFAASHLLDLLLAGLQVLPDDGGYVLLQATVLASMLVFVPGLADLAEVVPTLPSARPRPQFPRIWPLGVGLTIFIGTLSFILYGFTPEAEVVTILGLDGSILLIALLCVFLLLRARIGGSIGRSLRLALGGLLLFSLAHPLQIWLAEETTLPSPTLAVLHRLIVMPALILFALSISRVARSLSHQQSGEPTLASAEREGEERRVAAATHWQASPRRRAGARASRQINQTM